MTRCTWGGWGWGWGGGRRLCGFALAILIHVPLPASPLLLSPALALSCHSVDYTFMIARVVHGSLVAVLPCLRAGATNSMTLACAIPGTCSDSGWTGLYTLSSSTLETAPPTFPANAPGAGLPSSGSPLTGGSLSRAHPAGKTTIDLRSPFSFNY